MSTTRNIDHKKWTPSPTIEEETSDEEEEEESQAITNESDCSSSPSIPDEDINFEVVYTLHSFEATMDGQATVKKGDALTLLDDSNSYWWLIRDLKSLEVGYIPAENIETPFERLARLNKHRNIEITSLEQATFYNNNEIKGTIKEKKVILSTLLNVQLQILLTGEDEDEIEDEEYEVWDEEMLDDDDEEEEENDTTIKDEPENSKENHEKEDIPTTSTTTTTTCACANRDLLLNMKSKVLRIYAGNIDVGAAYHSIRVTETTSVQDMLANTMEKFHIHQIEQRYSSGIEYYLTVKARDSDEITLDLQDKPYEIHESLTAYLTTPMPSLAQFRQLVSSEYYTKRKTKSILDDDDVQFFMHKRIKHVNDKNGQVHIKVTLMTAATNYVEKINPLKKIASLGRFGSNKKKKKKEKNELERIDKLIAIPANITIAELTSIALVKFHIISDKRQPHSYILILNVNGKNKLLNTGQTVSNVLMNSIEDNSSLQEKYFLLQNKQQFLEDPSSLTIKQSMMTHLDSRTEAILKRIDATLEAYQISPNQPQQTKRNSTLSMFVSRNEKGIDIHLPHGLLRSTIISDKHIQYSLMKSPNILVLQKILPSNEDKNNFISTEEMSILIKYGTHYLDTYEASNTSNRLESHIGKEDDKSISSLEDLEKELHRIITSHSS
ncbi:uncharacterized protein BX663DRAFT_511827 [Cokeromyces recurvatus]|uniref:uncharacterized protein n=1 Tax=Cokeromyces recurvatus TaxID=90255 RepID=UPI002220E051|nr:uncharacterized protein BX663DRAFT_511827 [Cokeromyces recurvatus]KAI7902127.1 hypothetical protein BX663DRAFT_511827 [Cokeromyces recurvatus]